MLSRRNRQQSLLLEDYWARLRHGRRTHMLVAPPAQLDPDVVDSAIQLAATDQQLRPAPAFVATLRERLNAEAQTRPATPVRSWMRPAITPGRLTTADEHVDEVVVPASGREPLVQLSERRWLRESAKLVAAILVFVAVGVVLALTLRDTHDQPGVVVPLATPTTQPTAAPASPTAHAAVTPSAPAPATAAPVEPTRTTALPALHSVAIPVGAGPFGIAAGAGSIWVPNLGDGTLMRVDPNTNTVIATIAIGASTVDPLNMPSAPMAVAASDTAIWVTRTVARDPSSVVNELLRIDPATNAIVATIPLDLKPNFIALGAGALWITAREGKAVIRVDTATNAVVATIAVDSPFYVVADDHAVWVTTGPTANTSIGTVEHAMTQIDPLTNTVVGTFPVYQTTIWFAVGEGSLWIPDESARALLRVDPATYAVIARIPITFPGIPTVADGVVWMQSGILKVLTKIDPGTNTVVAMYPSANLGGPIVAFDGAIWIAEVQRARLVRMDP